MHSQHLEFVRVSRMDFSTLALYISTFAQDIKILETIYSPSPYLL